MTILTLKYSVFLLSILIISYPTFSQKKLLVQGEKIKGKSIYFARDGGDITYFTEDEENSEPVGSSKTFSLSNNFSNIYFKWLNPLRYKIIWKDSTHIDERDQILNDFVKLLTAKFGSSVTDLGKNTNSDLLSDFNSAQAKKKAQSPNKQKPSKEHKVSIDIPEGGFNSSELTILYLQFLSSQDRITDPEREVINKLTPMLKNLDTRNARNIPKEADDIFLVLYQIDNSQIALTSVKEQRENIKSFITTFNQTEQLKNDISAAINKIQMSDPLLQSFMITSVQKFLDQVISTLQNNNKIISKLGSILDLLDNSLKNKSNKHQEFYRNRNVSFDDGKVLETSVSISEYEINKDTKDLVKKGDVNSSKFTFRKYDFIFVSVSAGVFYSNTSLKSYGISPGSTDFTVTEETINKNSAVTALFCNINFGIRSRYFAPLIQLGIDPTKKNPFLLLGTGFSIPSARFAISGGGVWTWDQSLTKLSVGQKISSSTDLDKDVKNNFDVKPKGWYLGVQYNF